MGSEQTRRRRFRFFKEESLADRQREYPLPPYAASSDRQSYTHALDYRGRVRFRVGYLCFLWQGHALEHWQMNGRSGCLASHSALYVPW